jgi:hypothetical protein
MWPVTKKKHINFMNFNFPRSNNDMAKAQIYKVGATTALIVSVSLRAARQQIL